ncbi:MAG: hypothetical protein ABWY35_06385, partial [Pseudorhodoplanes sp.]
RRRPSPQAAVPPSNPQPQAPNQFPRAEPLPPPIEVPARPRVPPRVDAAPQRPDGQANPFPRPVGPPPQQQQVLPPPGGRINPAF